MTPDPTPHPAPHPSLQHRLGDALDRVSPGAARRALQLRERAARGSTRARVERLEREVRELRQLSRRLEDTLEVVGELLVPALDRDDARVRDALERLGSRESRSR